MLGEQLADLDLPDDPCGDHVSVKEAVLPFDRFAGADALLGPEMRSTGEVMGVAPDFPAAFAKAQAAAGARLPQSGTVFLTVTDSDKAGAVGVGGPAARPRLPDRRHARDGGGDRAHGHPGRAAQQARGGLAARGRQRSSAATWTSSSTRRPARPRARTATRSAARRSPAACRASRRSPAAWPPRARSRRRATASRPVRSLQEIHGTRAAAVPGGARGVSRPRAPVDRTLAPFGRRRVPVTGHRAPRRLRRCSPSPTPSGPAPDPGQFYMLAAAERWGGGEDERPFLPRAFSVARARRRPARLPARGRRPGTARLGELGPGDDALAARPARPRLRRRRATAAGRSWSAAASGSPRSRSGATRSARRRSCCSASATREHAEGAALIPGARVATDDGSVGHRGLVTELLAAELGRRPARRGLRLRPAAHARGGPGAVRRARRPGPARARVGHGLRLRRLLRLRRADADRLRAPVRRRARARRRGARGGRMSRPP